MRLGATAQFRKTRAPRCEIARARLDVALRSAPDRIHRHLASRQASEHARVRIEQHKKVKRLAGEESGHRLGVLARIHRDDAHRRPGARKRGFVEGGEFSEARRAPARPEVHDEHRVALRRTERHRRAVETLQLERSVGVTNNIAPPESGEIAPNWWSLPAWRKFSSRPGTT